MWCCRRAVAAAAFIVLIRTYMKSMASCIQRSVSSGVHAGAVCSFVFSFFTRFKFFTAHGWFQLQCVCWGNCFHFGFHLLRCRSYCGLLPSFLIRSPSTLLSWYPALFLSQRQVVVEPFVSPLAVVVSLRLKFFQCFGIKLSPVRCAVSEAFPVVVCRIGVRLGAPKIIATLP